MLTRRQLRERGVRDAALVAAADLLVSTGASVDVAEAAAVTSAEPAHFKALMSTADQAAADLVACFLQTPAIRDETRLSRLFRSDVELHLRRRNEAFFTWAGMEAAVGKPADVWLDALKVLLQFKAGTYAQLPKPAALQHFTESRWQLLAAEHPDGDVPLEDWLRAHELARVLSLDPYSLER